MAEQLNHDQIMDLIRQQYPELVPILSRPGVWDAISQAVQENWSPARLQASLQNTPYYRDTSDTARQWDILSSVDPATAQQRRDQTGLNLLVEAKSLGINLSNDQFNMATDAAVREGWDANMVKVKLISAARSGVWGGMDFAQPGAIGDAANLARQYSANYGVPLSDGAAGAWGLDIAEGTADEASLKDYMVTQAKSLFPGLTDALNAGVTTKQYADPYAQIAAKELNINPNDFQLADPKWNAALSQVDPMNGNKVPLSLDAWQTKIRTDPKYGYDLTAGAKAQAANLTTTLAQKFGVVAA